MLCDLSSPLFSGVSLLRRAYLCGSPVEDDVDEPQPPSILIGRRELAVTRDGFFLGGGQQQGFFAHWVELQSDWV